MSSTARPLTNTPADLLAYQSELVRTGDYLPLGRVNKIAIGPARDYEAPPEDAFIAKFGRMIDFRGSFLPIAHSRGQDMILITKPLIHPQWGVAGLPDVPHPDFKADPYTKEEAMMVVERDPKKDRAPMIPQRLIDRANQAEGRPAVLEGTDFLIFQPVLCITYKPEFDNKVLGTLWKIACGPDRSGIYPVLLVDHRTGEAHFFGGTYLIVKAFGEQ